MNDEDDRKAACDGARGRAVDTSIIVVNWNTRDLLAECLASVFESATCQTFEVLVVDNGSTDGSVLMVRRQFPQVQVIENRNNTGFAKANNQALQLARGRYVLLLNSDAVLPREALARLVAFMDSHPAAGAAGPLYVYPDGSFQASFADFPSLWNETLLVLGCARWFLGRHFPSYGREHCAADRQVDWIPGTSMLVRMTTIQDVGPLDERFFFYSEEVDWCYRMRQRGWEVWFHPAIIVIHKMSQTARKDTEASLTYLYRGKVRFFAKHHGIGKARVLRAAVLVNLCRKALVSLAVASIGRGHGERAQRRRWHVYLAVARTLMHEPILMATAQGELIAGRREPTDQLRKGAGHR